MCYIYVYTHLCSTGILHLGQVEFDSVTDLSGDSGVVSDQQPLLLAGKLLGIPAEQLEVALTKKKSLVIRGAWNFNVMRDCDIACFSICSSGF